MRPSVRRLIVKSMVDPATRDLTRIGAVRRASKALAGALALFLLGVGAAACGGGGGTSSSSPTEAAQSPTAQAPTQGRAAEGSGGSRGQGKGQGGGQPSKAKPGEEERREAPVDRKKEAAEFVPKRHHDSGGGSKQFEVKGGDNSVQEFGEEAGSQEFAAAATALHGFLDARAEGNWAAACEYMSKTIVESFEKLASQAKQIEDKSCAGILEKLTNPAAKAALKLEAKEANAGSLRTEGERAFVIYTGIKGTVLAMPMANEGGKWKVTSVAGTPLN